MLSCLCSVIQNGNDKVKRAGAKSGRGKGVGGEEGVKDESRLGPCDAPERNSPAINRESDVRLKRL